MLPNTRALAATEPCLLTLKEILMEMPLPVRQARGSGVSCSGNAGLKVNGIWHKSMESIIEAVVNDDELRCGAWHAMIVS